jgi:N-acyl-D-aspartate/D-glutamate deacylase
VDLDLVIRGGTVVDGTGAPARVADVGIAGDRIVAVGEVGGRAARVIDATVVNGEVVLEQGEHVGGYAGRVLRSGPDLRQR